MKAQTALRICVPLVWTILVADIALTLLLHDSLPAQLRDWRSAEVGQAASASGIFVNVLGATVIISGVVASIGLFRLRRWAGWLYMFSVVLGYALMPFSGPVVAHGLNGALSGAFSLVSGMVLALAFFTDALKSSLRVEPGAVPNDGSSIPPGNARVAQEPPSVG
jgi:hypothetical protein